MNYISMRLRILIALGVVLTPLAIWRMFFSSNVPAPVLSPEEAAIRKDQADGNVTGLVEKVETYSPKYAEKAVEGLGGLGPEALPLLDKVFKEDKRPKIRERVVGAMLKPILKAVKKGKPIPPKMTETLVTALANDESAAVRGGAAAALGRVYDYNSVPFLLESMDDPDASVRRKAHHAVSRIMGRRYVFDPTGPPAVRRATIKAIESDWGPMKNKVGDYHDSHRHPEKPAS